MGLYLDNAGSHKSFSCLPNSSIILTECAFESLKAMPHNTGKAEVSGHGGVFGHRT